MDQDTQNPTAQSEDETYKCAKCGKEKKKSEGHFFLEGSSFCCEKCCDVNKDKDKADNVCEFC